jgi:SAM-dependent methyltransferase
MTASLDPNNHPAAERVWSERTAAMKLEERGYHPRAGQPGYWAYAGIPIQASVETHRFAVAQAPPSETALDIAAGQGALSQALLDAGLRVSCTSWDGKVKPAIPTYRCDLDHPFGPENVGGFYDLVCAIEIIEHVENPASFLRSCASVLNPGGRIILSTPNVESIHARLQWLLRGVPAAFDIEEIRQNRHISLLWRQGLEFLIESAGLAVEARVILGAPRLGPPLRAGLKRAIYGPLGWLLGTEAFGTAVVYVLRRSASPARMPGPLEVY